MISSSIAIVIAGDARFYPRIATFMRMLREQNKTLIRVPVYILTDEKSFSENGDIIEKSIFTMGWRRGYDYDFRIIYSQCISQLPFRGHFGLACYLRLWIPNVLPDYDRYLYLDVDVLLRRPLSPLLRVDLEGKVVGAVNEPQGDAISRRLELRRPRAFNSGVLLIDRQRWIAEDVLGCCLDWLQNNHDRVVWPDQDALNAVLDTDVLDIDIRWNAMRNAVEHTPDPAIVHFNGSAKPWQYGMRLPYRHAYRYWLRRTPWPAELMENISLRNRLRETPLYKIRQYIRAYTHS